MAGTVGNLPEMPGMSNHYGQTAIFTPPGYFFARDAITNGTVLPLNHVIRDAHDCVIQRADSDEPVETSALMPARMR